MHKQITTLQRIFGRERIQRLDRFDPIIFFGTKKSIKITKNKTNITAEPLQRMM